MKKIALTLAVVLGITIGASAQHFSENGQPNNGGLFGRGATSEGSSNAQNGATPLLPTHGQTDNQDAPLGSGALLLIGFGAAYAASKRRK